MTEPDRRADADQAWYETALPPPRRRRWWGALLVLAGVAWLLVALEAPVPWDLVLPIAVIVVGLLILVLGRRARGDGLINLGIVLGMVALFTTFVPGALSLTAGERDHRYVEVAELDETRSLGAGRMTVDVRAVSFPDGVTHLPAGVTFGELVVLLPPEVAVSGDATVAAGQIVGFGTDTGGVGRSRTFDEPGEDGGAVVELELGVGFGKIEVRR